MTRSIPFFALNDAASKAVRRTHSFILVIVLQFFTTGVGAQQSSASSAMRNYEIPAQALDVALEAYMRTAGVQVLFETELTKGRRSTSLQGYFVPDVALKSLLSETGLVVRRTGIDAFVITQPPDMNIKNPMRKARPDGRFLAALQTSVVEALCRTSLTRPGGYKIAIELWVAQNGTIWRSALIGSTNDAERDRLMLSVLRGASVRIAPPTDFPQPFVLAIGPQWPRDTGDCL